MLLTSITYPKGNSIHYEYDSKGNLLEIKRKPNPDTIPLPDDIVTTFTYEPNFNFIKTITDPQGNTTTYDYDDKGNLIKITYPKVADSSPTVLFTYNQYGQIKTVTDPNGIITQYEYDPQTGYLTRIIKDSGDETHLNTTTQFSYDEAGNVTSITDPNGNTTHFQYNALNQLTQTTSAAPFSYQTKYSYDKNGNLTKIERQQDPEATSWQVTEYEYNLLDQLTKIKQLLNQDTVLTTQFQYDANGNRTKLIDAQGNSTTYVYDERDLFWKVTDALGNVTEYTYDGNGNLKEIKDANNNITIYQYDNFDRLIKTIYPDSSYEEYTYDANSNLLTKRTRKGDIITYAYDNLNRLTTKTYPDSSIVDYAYDIGSRLASVTDTNGTISYTYDALNRVKSVNNYGKTISYEYDAAGNRTKLTYPDNTYITYDYDELNRLTSIKDQASSTIASYSYDVLSRRNIQTTYQYDNVNRLLNLVNKINSGADISSFGYTYDNVGNRTSMTTIEGTRNYTYDNIYQLTNVTYPDTTSATYNYDELGNRSSTVNGGTTSYSTNNLNQYTSVGSTAYTYDANGNLTGDQTWTYTYDYENRLTQATNGTTTANYTYDPFGRRIEKDVDGTVTKFIYDGDQVIAEYDGSGTLIRKFIYGPGIDEPVRMTAGGSDYYYHFDGLGSVTEITNSSGAVVEKYEYDVYGNTVIKDGVGNVLTESAIGNPYGLGRRLDSETGLYYYRARYYSPELGRFLQKDPLTWGPDDPRILNLTSFNKEIADILIDSFGKSTGINLILSDFIVDYLFIISSRGLSNPQYLHPYLYVFNNPINWVDPFGFCPDDIPWWKELWRRLNIDVGYSGLAPGSLKPFVTFGVKIAPTGLYWYYGVGLGGGAGWSATINFGTPVSSNISVTGNIRGGAGWGAFGSNGITRAGGTGEIGFGAGIGKGGGVAITNTVPIIRW
jgi:RHS repeat-associated protein